MDLSIEVIESENKSIIKLSGEIDVYTAPNLKKTLIPLSEIEGQTIEVDMEKVNYMDSTGLGIFISLLKSSKEHGTDFKLLNLQDRVMRLFTITGLNEIINIHSTIPGVEE